MAREIPSIFWMIAALIFVFIGAFGIAVIWAKVAFLVAGSVALLLLLSDRSNSIIRGETLVHRQYLGKFVLGTVNTTIPHGGIFTTRCMRDTDGYSYYLVLTDGDSTSEVLPVLGYDDYNDL